MVGLRVADQSKSALLEDRDPCPPAFGKVARVVFSSSLFSKLGSSHSASLGTLGPITKSRGLVRPLRSFAFLVHSGREGAV